MWIKRLRLQNYASFSDSGWIDLDRNFNVFVGANNSGKTALLRSLSRQFENSPHRNQERFRDGELLPPMMEIDVWTTSAEIIERHKRVGSAAAFPGSAGNEEASTNTFLADIDREFAIEGQRLAETPYSSRDGASIADLRFPQNQTSFNIAQVDGQFKVVSNRGSTDNLVDVLNFTTDPLIFYFDPQRLHVGKAPFAHQSILDSDARNLPNVLLHLQGSRPDVFEKIVRHVVEISQSVKAMRATPNGSDIEIILWPIEDYSRREFSFALAESGTGIGQLIAILTAAATNDQCSIVIDEISTFLHPSATKRLISLLRAEYFHHQFIISTHSSDVISAIDPEKLYLIKKSGFESKIASVSPGNVFDLRMIGAELGFSMMDVFGHERVIWVEGETEAIVFPYILRAAGRPLGSGVGFAVVASTSDFDATRRSAQKITEIYGHVTKSVAPLLKGLSFGLDREGHSDEAIQKLERSKRKLKFLSRRTLENFVISPDAIAEVLSELDGKIYTGKDVEDVLLRRGGDAAYKARSVWNADIKDVSWLKKVDGAKLISDCFGELSNTRTEFRKTRDTPKLIKILFETDRDSIEELITFINIIVEVAMRDSRA